MIYTIPKYQIVMGNCIIRINAPDVYSKHVAEFTWGISARAMSDHQVGIHYDDDGRAIFYIGYFTFYYLKRTTDIKDNLEADLIFEDDHEFKDLQFEIIATSKDLFLAVMKSMNTRFSSDFRIIREWEILEYGALIGATHVNERILFDFGFELCKWIYSQNHVEL